MRTTVTIQTNDLRDGDILAGPGEVIRNIWNPALGDHITYDTGEGPMACTVWLWKDHPIEVVRDVPVKSGYIIHDAMSDRGFSGYFLAHGYGGFTVGPNGYAWVTNDFSNGEYLHANDHIDPCTGEVLQEADIAYSALIQPF